MRFAELSAFTTAESKVVIHREIAHDLKRDDEITYVIFVGHVI